MQLKQNQGLTPLRARTRGEPTPLRVPKRTRDRKRTYLSDVVARIAAHKDRN
jgi:hypothetical protein